VQLVAARIGLASLLTRAGVEFYLARQSAGKMAQKPMFLSANLTANCRFS